MPRILFILLMLCALLGCQKKGRDQLSGYLVTRGMDEGYLVTFDFSKNKQDGEPQWIDWNGKRIFEVVV